MTIHLFDFDNTIVNLPYEETINYLDKKESLDPELPFTLIEKTKSDYQDCLNNDPDGLFLLLSNRRVEVLNPLVKLLDKLGYNFEDYYLIKDEDRNKGNRVKQILKKYPSCKHVKYWEDKDKHIESVEKTMKEYPEITLEVIKTQL